MGKFFLGGVFLGAAVTWAAMTYIMDQGLRGESKDRFEEQVRLAAEAGAKEAGDKAWQRKLDTEIGALNKRAEDDRVRWEERIKSLSGENRNLQISLEGGQEQLKIAQSAIARLEKRGKDLEKLAGATSVASRQLLALRTKLIDVQVRLWRALGQSAAVLGQAMTGWPDLQLARESTRDLAELAKTYRALAEKVRVFIEQQSKALGDELGDLAPYRDGVQEGDIRKLEKLSATILSAVEVMKSDAVKVQANSEAWVDAEVLVKAGDVIHIRADGLWRMSDNWQPSGPEGWDGGGQYKISQDARAGALILRVGVSDRAYPAYLGKPIPATFPGRVMFRINDKDLRDNVGEVTVAVVSCNPEALKQVLEQWRDVIKK
jgi:hypothetical protein